MRLGGVVLLLAAWLPAQIGWVQDADMGRTLGNGQMWCDTSVTPNECFAFGGEHTIDVSRYFKDGNTWKWERSGWQAPAIQSNVLGPLQEWVGGRAEFLTRNHTGTAINRAVCISGTLFQFQGLAGKTWLSVWTFDRQSGFVSAAMAQNGQHPPHDRDFATCVVPYDPANPTGSGRIYRYGIYTGDLQGANRALHVLEVDSPTNVTWRQYDGFGSPPPPLAHCSLVYANGLILLFGGMRYELGAPLNYDMWITLPFPIGGRHLWIKIPGTPDGIKWKGAAWFQAGAFFRFGCDNQFDRNAFDHFEVLPLGWGPTWLRVPTSYVRPGKRWLNTGAYMPSENCYLMAGGWRMDGPNGLFLYKDSWRFKL